MTPFIVAVIPIRYQDVCTPDGTPRFVLSKRPLWDITIGQALQASRLQSVIVAYDDERFLPFLDHWGDRITRVLRPAELSLPTRTTMDVLRFVAKEQERAGQHIDFLLLLEITHPLRPKDIIDQVATVPATSDSVDSVVTCHPQHYNFWHRQPDGEMVRIAGPGDAPDTALYQEVSGICSLFSPKWLETDKPFGEMVDVVPISRFWATIDVRDEDGLWLAQRYLERIGAEL